MGRAGRPPRIKRTRTALLSPIMERSTDLFLAVPVPCSLFPTLCSLFPIPCSLLWNGLLTFFLHQPSANVQGKFAYLDFHGLFRLFGTHAAFDQAGTNGLAS